MSEQDLIVVLSILICLTGMLVMAIIGGIMAFWYANKKK